MIKVSVIIPIYNVELYISECIDSVLNQNFSHFEILLINDGSTDSSLAICEKYAKIDSRIKVYNKKNGGISSARNYGMDKAQGEYIIFLDSDDFWLNDNALEQLVAAADDTDADLVRGEYHEFKDGEICPNNFTYQRKGSLSVESISEFLTNSITSGFFIWLYLFRRKSINKLRFDEEQKFQEDIEFTLRLFANPLKCVYLPFVFYAYRKRAQSLTTTINVNNLYFSFKLSRRFGLYSDVIQDDSVRRIYLTKAVEIYHSTLETLVSDDYYKDSHSLIENFKLKDLQKDVNIWAKSSSKKIYPFTVYMSPDIASVLLRKYIKVRKFFLIVGSKCKRLLMRILNRLRK